jgi:hypothetical protein
MRDRLALSVRIFHYRVDEPWIMSSRIFTLITKHINSLIYLSTIGSFSYT